MLKITVSIGENMKIKSLEIQDLRIPFNTGFKHSKAERKITQTILVILISDTGQVGIGEGCPREYVSGESISSCKNFINSIKGQIIHFSDLDEILNWIQEHKRQINKNPAAWCAVELALLDLLGRSNGMSIEELLSLRRLNEPFIYTAVLGDSSDETYKKQIEKFIQYGFQDFKIKITGDIQKDKRKLGFISKYCISKYRTRFDGNNLWKSSSDVIKYLNQFEEPIFGIEEPLEALNFKGLYEIIQELPIKIILDESFLDEDHFSYFEKDVSSFIINVRISKMGGIIRSLKICNYAKKIGCNIIVGAQVGETSILTRAALTVANNFREELLAQEGAFGTFLLSEDVVKEPLMFKSGGVLNSTEYLEEKIGGFQLNYKSNLLNFN